MIELQLHTARDEEIFNIFFRDHFLSTRITLISQILTEKSLKNPCSLVQSVKSVYKKGLMKHSLRVVEQSLLFRMDWESVHLHLGHFPSVHHPNGSGIGSFAAQAGSL